ncbi:unnamed protein product [Zymoseptoria tritici ST99CH_1A5]|uniref:Enoyl reductase (ER) domain-containing protein n=1 Tax=Zymoseptoria tritici ST99CH_1A5 TaxID=1276529 RepID=A0A1Y6M1T2_ZYMTR|nr:unnamed protein product [Zymoseptoria tritici ST99CH_1A5]
MAFPRPTRAFRSPLTAENLTKTTAIVASEPGEDHKPAANWSLQEVYIPTELNDGEVLVEMVATGICHTDISLTGPGMAQGFPIVPGHEGSGYIRALGPSITKSSLQVGDPVLLSFDHCTACLPCTSSSPAYCDTFAPLNLFGESSVFHSSSSPSESNAIGGKFFGHSSFSKLSIVKETSILSAKGLVKDMEELKLFAPLGCGIQTGAGAISNLVKPGKEDVVAVMGLGGVGLSAVMAAKIAGCKSIIAVDRVESRIEEAKSLFGATHGLNTTGIEDLAAALKEITGGRGPNVVIETTGHPAVLEPAYASVATKGSFVIIGGPPQGYEMKFDYVQHLFRGIKVFGCVEGDSVPEKFIPEMIAYYREGKLPVDKMVKFYKAEDFKEALHDMHAGKAIKPVLVW